MGKLAEQLWDARLNNKVVARDAVEAPFDEAAAYDVQWDIVSLSGCEVCGFKATTTSLEAQQLLGTKTPGSAALLCDYVYAAPARMGVNEEQHPAVEGEFIMRLGKDLPPRPDEPYSYEEMAAAIDAVAGGIDVVGTRIAGGLAGLGASLVIADGGVNVALVIGTWTSYKPDLNLRDHCVAMNINGERCGEGSGARVLGDPINVLLWIANQQSARGRGLFAGEIIASGTCTGLDRVKNLAWSSVNELVEIKDDKHPIVLCHYPMITWNRARRGALQLFGHVHERWQGTSNSINVGVDVWNFMPVQLADIQKRAETLPANSYFDIVEPGSGPNSPG